MRVKRKCELCSNIATIFCESDQANLCYECDSKVHGANFLVSKHSRTLLCHICQSPTLWSGSGPKFGPTISVCPTCLSAKNDARHHNNNVRGLTTSHGRVAADDEDLNEDDDDEEEDDNDDDDDDDDDDDGNDGFEDGDSDNGDEDDDEHEDDEENQVVPWSYSVSHSR